MNKEQLEASTLGFENYWKEMRKQCLRRGFDKSQLKVIKEADIRFFFLMDIINAHLARIEDELIEIKGKLP